MASYKKYQYDPGARQRPDHVSFVAAVMQPSYPVRNSIRQLWSENIIYPIYPSIYPASKSR